MTLLNNLSLRYLSNALVKLLFLTILLTGTINAQDNFNAKNSFPANPNSSPFILADTTIVLKRGVYKTFNEFKYNRPSELAEFVVNTKERHYNFGKDYTHYQIEFVNEADRQRIYSDTLYTIWGFCDGEYVYKFGQSQFLGKYNYDRLKCIGRYIMYDEFSFATGGGATMMGSGNNVQTRIIDINNGKKYYLTVKRVKKLISSDPELLDSYMAEENKKEMMFFIIKHFNERYKMKW